MFSIICIYLIYRGVRGLRALSSSQRPVTEWEFLPAEFDLELALEPMTTRVHRSLDSFFSDKKTEPQRDG